MKYLKQLSKAKPINESRYGSIISKVSSDILEQFKAFMQSDLEEAQIDLPDEGEYYQTPSFFGDIHDFFIELYLFKHDLPGFKIDGDAPGEMDEQNIRVIIYANPNNYQKQLNLIYQDLIYTIQHEFEHFLQVLTDYERVGYSQTKTYKGDSLSTLLKAKEIEPQVRGYYLLAKKKRIPFEQAAREHLNKMEMIGQVKFASPERKDILIKTLIDHAKKLNLPIRLN